MRAPDPDLVCVALKERCGTYARTTLGDLVYGNSSFMWWRSRAGFGVSVGLLCVRAFSFVSLEGAFEELESATWPE